MEKWLWKLCSDIAQEMTNGTCTEKLKCEDWEWNLGKTLLYMVSRGRESNEKSRNSHRRRENPDIQGHRSPRRRVCLRGELTISVQFSCSVVSDSAIPWTAARQASLSITNSRSLPKPMFIELMMPSNHLILCRPLLSLPSIFPSIRVFSNESSLHIRWPNYWSFSFNISPSNEHPGLISFRIDWLDILAVQGTLKSLLQYHSSKPSILKCSAFFIVQLSHPDHWKNHILD